MFSLQKPCVCNMSLSGYSEILVLHPTRSNYIGTRLFCNPFQEKDFLLGAAFGEIRKDLGSAGVSTILTSYWVS